MILAAAQYNPIAGDPRWNLKVHTALIREAADSGAGLILFPEMSLTGYLRENAGSMAYDLNGRGPDELRELASAENIIIVSGAPVLSGKDLHIGSLVFLPDGSVSVYCKKYLHQGEEKYFKPSYKHDPVIRLQGEIISLAICADIENPDHPRYAARVNQCSLYLASIFYSMEGIQRSHTLLREYAEKYGIHVLMANFCGKHQGTEAGGSSAFWDKSGKLIAALETEAGGLLVIHRRDGQWKRIE